MCVLLKEKRKIHTSIFYKKKKICIVFFTLFKKYIVILYMIYVYIIYIYIIFMYLPTWWCVIVGMTISENTHIKVYIYNSKIYMSYRILHTTFKILSRPLVRKRQEQATHQTREKKVPHSFYVVYSFLNMSIGGGVYWWCMVVVQRRSNPNGGRVYDITPSPYTLIQNQGGYTLPKIHENKIQ